MRKSEGRHNKLPERQEEPMKARIIPIDDPARLSDEQKARIIATAYAGPKSFLWRANELKNIGYCNRRRSTNRNNNRSTAGKALLLSAHDR